MPQSLTSLYYHIVFSTKERRPLITPDLQPRLYDYIGGAMLGIGGSADYLHICTTIYKDMTVVKAIQTIKGTSSKWVHDTFPATHAFSWQAGYSIFSVSRRETRRILEYIAGQAAHHRVKSFQEELLAIFEEEGIAYDERYLWE
jgi:putative transposase